MSEGSGLKGRGKAEQEGMVGGKAKGCMFSLIYVSYMNGMKYKWGLLGEVERAQEGGVTGRGC